jgi:hypothetical protein
VFSALFCEFLKWIEAEVVHDLRVMWRGWEDFVAFPAAKRDGANFQHTSGFRLKDFQLQSASPEMTSNRFRLLRHLNSTVAGWWVFVA